MHGLNLPEGREEIVFECLTASLFERVKDAMLWELSLADMLSFIQPPVEGGRWLRI